MFRRSSPLRCVLELNSGIFLVCLFALSMISYALISDIYYDDTEISPTEKHRIQHQEETEKLD